VSGPPGVNDVSGGGGGGATPVTKLELPTAEQLLDNVLRLGHEIHLEMDTKALVERFLGTLTDLFPGRKFLVRVVDLRSRQPAAMFATSEVRAGIASERIGVKQSSVEKTRLKSAIVNSARIKVGRRWDSPFPAVATGFAVLLVASGEFYGVLDVGYPLGVDLSEQDETLMLPLANYLSVALRNERLHRDTSILRDYQTKLIEHANALILGVDREWRIHVANQALCRLTGYAHSEVIGRDLRDWLPPEQRPRLIKLFLKALTGASADTVDVNLPTKSGGVVRTVWSIAAISGGREIEAMVAIGQDQTKLRELQSQVIQAEKLATLGQLAAGVVHELNNPLTSITVYAEFLLKKLERQEGVPEGDIEKLRRISEGAQRIMEFAKDLVQYAAPTGDVPDKVTINQVVKQSLSFCEHLFDQVELTQSLEQELSPLFAVPGQLEQVVINLVTNAVQAVGDGGHVLVKTFQSDAGKIVLSVSDNGPGISAANAQKIFEPFFTTKTDGEGTGLGLSIVANIVEQHQGTISVADGPMGGAEITVTLPAITA